MLIDSTEKLIGCYSFDLVGLWVWWMGRRRWTRDEERGDRTWLSFAFYTQIMDSSNLQVSSARGRPSCLLAYLHACKHTVRVNMSRCDSEGCRFLLGVISSHPDTWICLPGSRRAQRPEGESIEESCWGCSRQCGIQVPKRMDGHARGHEQFNLWAIATNNITFHVFT
jgi:hypothetical protein